MKTKWQQGLLVALAIAGGSHFAAAQELQRVEINKLNFVPAEITIHIGDSVVWTNNDPIAHTATAKTNETSAAWEVLIPIGKTAEYRPTQAGTISYYCRFHPNMKGSVVVLSK
jgi:plastocyanin